MSIPDLSVLALSYELVRENNLNDLIRNEPKVNIVENAKVVKKEKKIKEKIQEEEENKKFSNEEEAKITTMNIDDFPDLNDNQCMRKSQK